MPPSALPHMDKGGHFVLVVGYDRAASGDTLYVNDPGFDRVSYSFTKDVVGWRLYAMARAVGSGSQVVGRSDFEAQRSAIATALPATASAA